MPADLDPFFQACYLKRPYSRFLSTHGAGCGLDREDVPLFFSRISGGLTVVILALAATSAQGQARIAFPSVIPESSVYSSGQQYFAGQAGSVAPQPYYTGQAPVAAPAGTIPAAPGSFDPYGRPASPFGLSTPTYTSPAAAPTFAAPAGTAAPVGSPYGAPYALTYPAPGVLPYGGTAPATVGTSNLRFLARVKADNNSMLRMGNNGLGLTDLGISASFSFPFFQNAPIFVTPGFRVTWWDGPAYSTADMPPQTYDAYIDTSWTPQINPWFGIDVGVRVGVYSDFNAVTSQSLRIMGRGLGVFTFNPQFQAVLGVVYLDRLRIKLLPAGGVIWLPNRDTRLDILFPNPKLAHRLGAFRNTDIWGYLSAEYGGGKWSIERLAGNSDAVEYDDIRVMLGLDFLSFNGMRGYSEIGYVFQRRLIYLSGNPHNYIPSDTVMFRSGLSF